MFSQLQTIIIERIHDPRSPRNQRHPFLSIVITAVLAVMAGCTNFTQIEEYVEVNFDDLEEWIPFPNGVPSHDTYARVLESINPQELFQICIAHITNHTSHTDVGELLHCDGKVICNTKEALCMVSMWASKNQLMLGQQKVDGKSNEITAIPVLLDNIEIKDKIITIDAMGAQRAICEQIKEKGGDYVIALKGNQTTLFDDVKTYFKDNSTSLINENVDKGHGRIEIRKAFVQTDISWLKDGHKWPGIEAIGMIESTITKKKKTTTELRYYISSVKKLTAEKLNEIVRAHWSIENQLHWRLDVLWNEDKSCIRNTQAAENMHTLRVLALNIVSEIATKQNKSSASVIRKFSRSLSYMRKTLKGFFHA